MPEPKKSVGRVPREKMEEMRRKKMEKIRDETGRVKKQPKSLKVPKGGKP